MLGEGMGPSMRVVRIRLGDGASGANCVVTSHALKRSETVKQKTTTYNIQHHTTYNIQHTTHNDIQQHTTYRQDAT